MAIEDCHIPNTVMFRTREISIQIDQRNSVNEGVSKKTIMKVKSLISTVA